jgi:hypothetical protein
MDGSKQCLAICMEASEQADQVWANILQNVSVAKEAHEWAGAQGILDGDGQHRSGAV